MADDQRIRLTINDGEYSIESVDDLEFNEAAFIEDLMAGAARGNPTGAGPRLSSGGAYVALPEKRTTRTTPA